MIFGGDNGIRHVRQYPDLNLYLSIQRHKYTSMIYMSYSIHRNVYSKYSKFKAHDQIASIYHKLVIITADLSPIFWKFHIHPLSNPMTKHILALEPTDLPSGVRSMLPG